MTMSNDSRALAMILDLNDQLRAEKAKTNALQAELNALKGAFMKTGRNAYLTGLNGEVIQFDGKGSYTVETTA